MFKRTLHSLLAAAIATVGTLSVAHAANQKYEFVVNWGTGVGGTGELSGTSSTGWLSFDSSIAAPNAEYFEQDVLSDFGFSLRGHAYGLADVSVGFLTFDSAGDLRLLGVGTHCGSGYCASDPGNTSSFYLVYDSQSGQDRFFGVAGDPGWATSYGAGTFQIAPVPEPSSAALLALGGLLVGAAGLRRRAATGA